MILSMLKPGETGQAHEGEGAGAGPIPPFYKRRKKRGNELGQILLRAGRIQPEQLRRALAIQDEEGGQIGAILVRMGACSLRAIADALIEQVKLRRQVGLPEELTARAREEPGILGLQVPCKPRLTSTILVLTDLFMLVIAGSCARGLAERSWTAIAVHQQDILLVAALGLVAFAMAQLYSTTPPSPPDEIRRCFQALTLVHLGVTGIVQLHATVFFGYGRSPYAYGWLISIFIAPLGRGMARYWLAKKPWWGRAAVVFGAGKVGRSLVRTLRARPQLGLKPVVILDDDASTHGTLRAAWTGDDIALESVRQIPIATKIATSAAATAPIAATATAAASAAATAVASASPSSAPPPMGASPSLNGSSTAGSLGAVVTASPLPPEEPAPISTGGLDSPSVRAVWGRFSEVEGVPVAGTFELAPVLAQRLGIRSAVLAMPHVDADEVKRIIEQVGGTFDNILVIPDLFNLEFLGAATYNLGGVLGIELRQQLLLPGPRFVKRMMDLVLTMIGGALVLPLLLLIALAVKLDSPGPVLYWQKRLGQDGARFPSFKFRTMYGDGEKRLAEVLEANPKLKAEYETFHKLSDDPRITRVGKILRRYSLDELPQILNVLRGEMSLVGPRPYLEREIPDMDQQEWIILRVKPGITGIWQVTERNATSFRERVRMDVEYVRNWSPWLDIYVLARTVTVVLAGTGS